MPKLFWALLAACQGGNRYLRAVMQSITGLVSRLGQAPGSDAGAEMEQGTALDAGMVGRTAVDGRLDARTDAAGLAGRMVAWLVSVGYPALRAGLAWMITSPDTAPGSGMGKQAEVDTELTGAMDPSPGSPGGFQAVRTDGMGAGAEASPPVPVKARQGFDRPELGAGSRATDPAEISGVWLEVRDRMIAGMGPGDPVMGAGAYARETALTARMMTWSAPEWVDEKTLFIRQVYEIEEDGTTLVLY